MSPEQIESLKSATPDTICQELLSAVERLLTQLTHPSQVLDELQHVRRLLAAVPLATSEFGTAANRRLVNALSDAPGVPQATSDAHMCREVGNWNRNGGVERLPIALSSLRVDLGSAPIPDQTINFSKRCLIRAFHASY